MSDSAAQCFEDALERTAIFDATGDYRYRLDRRWDTHGPTVTFIMLNPSRADGICDDPTLRACLQFARRWDYVALSVVNLFGYCTPHPKVLKAAKDPVGPQNDDHILQAIEEATEGVLAWGNWGSLMGRDRTVLNLLAPHQSKLRCLALNRSGQPRHPLYIQRSTLLQPFRIIPS